VDHSIFKREKKDVLGQNHPDKNSCEKASGEAYFLIFSKTKSPVGEVCKKTIIVSLISLRPSCQLS
jgi:hypothetical protein